MKGSQLHADVTLHGGGGWDCSGPGLDEGGGTGEEDEGGEGYEGSRGGAARDGERAHAPLAWRDDLAQQLGRSASGGGVGGGSAFSTPPVAQEANGAVGGVTPRIGRSSVRQLEDRRLVTERARFLGYAWQRGRTGVRVADGWGMREWGIECRVSSVGCRV